MKVCSVAVRRDRAGTCPSVRRPLCPADKIDNNRRKRNDYI